MRVRYNNTVGVLGASLSSGGTSITFASAPPFATLTSGQYIPLVIDPPTSSPNGNFEIVHLTAYTASGTTGTIARGQEGTSGVAHSNGVTWSCAPSVVDAPSGISVMEYGAVGDGSTNDSTAIQNAINAAHTLYGVTGGIVNVVFPSGYNFLCGNMTVDNGVRLWCHGATFTPSLGSQQSMFLYSAGSSGSILTNFEICGGTWAGTGNEDLNQFIFNTNSNRGTQNLVFRDMKILNWGENPIYARNPTNVNVLDNYMLNPGMGYLSSYNAVNLVFDGGATATGGALVRGNTILGCSAFAIDPQIAGPTNNMGPLNVNIVDNVCTGGSVTATMGVTHDSTAVTNIVIPSGNTIFSGTGLWVTGTGLSSSTNQKMVVGSSNTATLSSQWTGTTGTLTVTLQGIGAGGISCEFDSAATARGFLICRNYIQGYTPTGTFGIINVGGSGSTVTEVIIAENVVDFTGAPNNANQVVSFFGTASPADGTVVNNKVTGGAAGNLFQSTLPTVHRGNQLTTGLISGTATLSGSGTATVSTVEIYGPAAGDEILLSRQAAGGTLGHLSVGTITAGTSFVINSSSSSDTSTVYWEIVH